MSDAIGEVVGIIVKVIVELILRVILQIIVEMIFLAIFEFISHYFRVTHWYSLLYLVLSLAAGYWVNRQLNFREVDNPGIWVVMLIALMVFITPFAHRGLETMMNSLSNVRKQDAPNA